MPVTGPNSEEFGDTSSNHPLTLARYKIRWEDMESPLVITQKVGDVHLLDKNGNARTAPLYQMQGATFSDDGGQLYLANGLFCFDIIPPDDCLDFFRDKVPTMGIHVYQMRCHDETLDCIALEVLQSSRFDETPFQFEFHPGNGAQEPEGITYWDLQAPGAPAVPGVGNDDTPVASSQLHALMLDNSPDNIFLKHYQVGPAGACANYTPSLVPQAGCVNVTVTLLLPVHVKPLP